MSSRTLSCFVALTISLALSLPGAAMASPPEPEVDDEAAPAEGGDGSPVGGVYGESVNYGWDHALRPQPPDAGPIVTIEVHDAIRPVYLRRDSVTGPEVCEAPCERRIGEASGSFVLTGPGRKPSKPFSLASGDSLRIVAKGGKRSRALLALVAVVVGVGGGVALAITPTRVNMPKTAGIGMWAGAGVLAAAGLGGGFVLFRFSRTQVRVLSD